MNLFYLQESKLDKLKRSVEENIPRYSEEDAWLESYFGKEHWKFETNIYVDDIKLLEPEGARELHDFENTKIIYTAMKNLSISEATDERLWTYLTHVTFWDYMRERWPVNESKSLDAIRQRYFFSSNKDRSLIRNGIARLWWYGHVSYDSNRNDPFELTRVLLDNTDLALNLLERSLSRNTILTRAILSVLAEREQADKPFKKREEYRKLLKHVNFLGGVTIIDALDEADLKTMLHEKIDKIAQ